MLGDQMARLGISRDTKRGSQLFSIDDSICELLSSNIGLLLSPASISARSAAQVSEEADIPESRPEAPAAKIPSDRALPLPFAGKSCDLARSGIAVLGLRAMVDDVVRASSSLSSECLSRHESILAEPTSGMQPRIQLGERAAAFDAFERFTKPALALLSEALATSVALSAAAAVDTLPAWVAALALAFAVCMWCSSVVLARLGRLAADLNQAKDALAAT